MNGETASQSQMLARPKATLMHSLAVTNSNQGDLRYDGTAFSATHEIDWIQDIIAASNKDTRKQPWKSTFVTPVDSRFDDGQDLVTVKKTTGGSSDPLCPFKTQGSSLAA